MRDAVGRGERKRELFRTKIEEMHQCCCEVEEWCGNEALHLLVTAGPSLGLKSKSPDGVPPSDRLETLVSIYQPELTSYMEKVKSAVGDFGDGCGRWAVEPKEAAAYRKKIDEPMQVVRAACRESKTEICRATRERYL